MAVWLRMDRGCDKCLKDTALLRRFDAELLAGSRISGRCLWQSRPGRHVLVPKDAIRSPRPFEAQQWQVPEPDSAILQLEQNLAPDCAICAGCSHGAAEGKAGSVRGEGSSIFRRVGGDQADGAAIKAGKISLNTFTLASPNSKKSVPVSMSKLIILRTSKTARPWRGTIESSSVDGRKGVCDEVTTGASSQALFGRKPRNVQMRASTSLRHLKPTCATAVGEWERIGSICLPRRRTAH